LKFENLAEKRTNFFSTRKLSSKMPVPDYLLSESAAGYALWEVTESEEIGSRSTEFLETLLDLYAFSKLVKLVSFSPFKTAAHALENINDVSEGNTCPVSDEMLIE
jgi:hypothetical protein